MFKRIWWYLRGLGRNGEHHLHLCQRCSRRGLAHVSASSVLACRCFKPLIIRFTRGEFMEMVLVRVEVRRVGR
jgi:hypothetical protein